MSSDKENTVFHPTPWNRTGEHDNVEHQEAPFSFTQINKAAANMPPQFGAYESQHVPPPPPYPGFAQPNIANETTKMQNVVTTRAPFPQPRVLSPMVVENQSFTESIIPGNDSFQNYSEDIRNGIIFLRKIFGLLHMLLFLGVICMFTFRFQREIYYELLWAQWPVTATIVIAIAALLILTMVSISGSNTAAMILQLPFVLCLLFTMAYAVVQTESNLILYITATVSATFLTTFIYTLQSRWDFTVGIVVIVSFLPAITSILTYLLLALASFEDDPSRYVIVIAVSSLIYVPVLTVAYMMVHQKPGEPVFGQINLKRSYDSWALCVMHLYLGVLVACAVLLFSGLLILAAMSGRFYCCIYYRSSSRGTRNN